MSLLNPILSLFVFLGVNENRNHPVFVAMSSLLRGATIFILAAILTIVIGRLLPINLPMRSETDRLICGAVAGEGCSSIAPSTTSPAATATSADQAPTSNLRDRLLEVAQSLRTTYKIRTDDVRVHTIGHETEGAHGDDHEAGHGQYDYSLVMDCMSCDGQGLGGSNQGKRVVIYTVQPVLQDAPILSAFSQQDLWPFKSVVFESSPYALSALLIEAATLPNRPGGLATNSDFNTEDIRKARQKIDALTGILPSANNSTYTLSRRLVGPIQIGCYFLFSLGLINILFTYLSTVLPNALIRARKSVKLEDEIIVTKQTGRSYTHLASRDYVSEDDDVIAENILAPWSKANQVHGSAEDFERFYSKLSNKISRKFGWLGSTPILPLCSLRRIGYMAMQSSSTGSNVPAFINSQADSYFELMEAHSKTIQFLIWAIPTLGFIGTVLGIGDALLSTVDIQSSVLSTKAIAESKVGSSIGVAFDTTFVALVLSFILMLFNFAVQSAQEQMLSIEKRTAIEEIVQPGNISNSRGSDVSEITQAIYAALQQAQSQNGQPPQHYVQPTWRDEERPRSTLARIAKSLAVLTMLWAVLWLLNHYGPSLMEQAEPYLGSLKPETRADTPE